MGELMVFFQFSQSEERFLQKRLSTLDNTVFKATDIKSLLGTNYFLVLKVCSDQLAVKILSVDVRTKSWVY